MFKFFFILLCFIKNINGDILNVGESYNITWNNTYTNQVGIVLETKINNSWVVTREQEYKYLSIVLDNKPNYFIWDIPSGLSNYWMYDNRILVVNLENKTIIKNNMFNIREPAEELTTLNQDPTDMQITNNTTTTTTTPTIKDFNIENEETDDKDEICIKDTCLPTYAFIIIIIVSFLIVLWLCCQCCC
jgi:hypothetical protein